MKTVILRDTHSKDIGVSGLTAEKYSELAMQLYLSAIFGHVFAVFVISVYQANTTSAESFRHIGEHQPDHGLLYCRLHFL